MSRHVVMIKSLIVNFILIVIKLIGGLTFNSAALVADAMHSISDFFTDILIVFGLKQSNKPPDEEHPLGHGKIEYVVSLLLGLGIVFIAYQIVRTMIITLLNSPSIPSIVAIIIPIGVIVIKGILARYIMQRGKVLHSQALIASASESYADMLSSIIVLLGILLAAIGTEFNIGYLQYADSVGAILIGVLILRVAYKIIKDAIISILGKSAPSDILEETKRIVETLDGVYRVDNLRMIVYGHYYQALISIRVDGNLSVKKGHDIASMVKRKMKKNPKISHVLVHVNPEVE